MKKILVVATLLISCISASAQNFSFGGGFLNSRVNYDKDMTGTSNNGSNGFYVQGTAGKDFSSTFGIVAGLRYAFTSGDFLAGYGKTKNHYVGVPVMAKVNFVNTGDFKLFVFAGPTAYYGLSSKAEAAGLSTDLYKTSNLNRFNVTLGGGLGVDAMEVIRFTVGYDYGLMDRYDKFTSKTGDFRLGVAYLF